MTKPTESQVLSASIEALLAEPGKPASTGRVSVNPLDGPALVGLLEVRPC